MEIVKKIMIVNTNVKKKKVVKKRRKSMWPSNHEDKITLKEKGEIRKLPIVS